MFLTVGTWDFTSKINLKHNAIRLNTQDYRLIDISGLSCVLTARVNANQSKCPIQIPRTI